MSRVASRRRASLERRRGRRAAARVALLLLAAAGVAAAASAAEKAPETLDPEASCVSARCHADVTRHETLHWDEMAEVGECQKCHETEDEELHEFTTDDSGEACLACHESLAEDVEDAEQVHDPLEDGCLDCHDPHATDTEALLLNVEEEDLRPLCFDCHEEDILDGKYAHGPVDQGACTECHDPHASSYATLLLGEQPEMCGDCHEEVAEEIEEAEYVHDPVEDSCLDCHAAHSSPYPKILLAKKRELCNECHDDVVDTAQDASVAHEPTTTRDECLNCHLPHASDHEYNLKKSPTDVCLSCHDEPVEVDGVELVDMKRWLKRNPEWHEPIREEGCNACHQPHGGENRRLLTDAYPRKLYLKFAVEEYALCFRCHEKELATVRRTRSLTGFRDGSRNLHFLHVNKEKRGRSCRACHDVHATQNPLQLRETAPYGKWDMPINFEQKPTGGSCHPGCHRLRSYDREARDRPGG